MPIRSVCRAVLPALAMAACGGTEPTPPPPPPPGPPAELVVTPASITATGIGEQLSVQVTLGGQAVSGVTFTIQSEQRWLHDLAVLDPVELGQARLVTHAPGRAEVRVAASGRTATLSIDVAPPAPFVVETRLPGGRRHLGTADTIVLRGWRMHQVTGANLQTGGIPLTLAAADSANRRVVVPTLETGACAGTAPAFTLTFSGIGGSPVTGLTRRRSGELDLAPGEPARLPSAGATCVRLAPAGSARYLVAYADGRLASRALTQPESPWPADVTITLTDHSGGGAGGQAPVRPANPPPAADRIWTGHLPAQVLAAVPPECPLANVFRAFCRTTPWALGEVFTHSPAGTGRPPGPARVVSIRGNLVLAVFEADEPLLAPEATAYADAALEFMVQRGIPLLRGIYELTAPTTTSDDAGQLLVVLEQAGSSFAFWWPDPSDSHGRWGQVALHVVNSAFDDARSSMARALSILAHEILHTYQFRYRYEHARPWIGSLGTLWAVEGGATMFQLEMVREAIGLPFLGNNTIPPANEDDPYWALSYGFQVQDVTMGYSQSASFLRDLVQRLVTGAGLAFDAALGVVLRGSLEGWHGINEEGIVAGPGLTARMRAHLGPAWTPLDALLDWTMSQAADDLTENPAFQHLGYRPDNPSTATNTIRPHALVTSGGTASVTRLAGTTGVFELLDLQGGSYGAAAAVGGVPESAVGWLVLRIP